MDKITEFTKTHKGEPYLLVGDAEFQQIKDEWKKNKGRTILIARVEVPTFLDWGTMEFFFHEERIRIGVRSNNGKFYRIASDHTVVETKKPRQPKWFKELNLNE